MAEYPKAMYHKHHPARRVDSAAEEAALGREWVRTPADVDKPFAAPPPPAPPATPPPAAPEPREAVKPSSKPAK